MSDDTESQQQNDSGAPKNGSVATPEVATPAGGEKPSSRFGGRRVVLMADDADGEDVDTSADNEIADQAEAAQKEAEEAALAEKRRRIRAQFAGDKRKVDDLLRAQQAATSQAGNPVEPQEPESSGNPLLNTAQILRVQREVRRDHPNRSDEEQAAIVQRRILGKPDFDGVKPPSNVVDASDKFPRVPTAPQAKPGDRLIPTPGVKKDIDMPAPTKTSPQGQSQTNDNAAATTTAYAEEQRARMQMAMEQRQAAVEQMRQLNESQINAAFESLSKEKNQKLEELNKILNDENASEIDKEIARAQILAIEAHHKNAFDMLSSLSYEANQKALAELANISNNFSAGQPQKQSALGTFLHNLFSGSGKKVQAFQNGDLTDRIRRVSSEYQANVEANRTRFAEFAKASETVYQKSRDFEAKTSKAFQKFNDTTEGEKLQNLFKSLSMTSGMSTEDVARQFYGQGKIEPVLRDAIMHARKYHKEMFKNSTNPDIQSVKEMMAEANNGIPDIEKEVKRLGAALETAIINHPDKSKIDPDKLRDHVMKSVQPFIDNGNTDPTDVDGTLAEKRAKIMKSITEMMEKLSRLLGRLFGRGGPAASDKPSAEAPAEAAAAAPGM